VLRIDVDAADLEQPLRHRTEALCARPDVGAVRAVLRIDVDAVDFEELKMKIVDEVGLRYRLSKDE